MIWERWTASDSVKHLQGIQLDAITVIFNRFALMNDFHLAKNVRSNDCVMFLEFPIFWCQNCSVNKPIMNHAIAVETGKLATTEAKEIWTESYSRKEIESAFFVIWEVAFIKSRKPVGEREYPHLRLNHYTRLSRDKIWEILNFETACTMETSRNTREWCTPEPPSVTRLICQKSPENNLTFF